MITAIFTVRNDMEADDCAYDGLDGSNYYDKPVELIQSKGSMGHTFFFFEMKILWGNDEFLAVDGCHSNAENRMEPFLGSALKNWSYGSQNNGLCHTLCQYWHWVPLIML